MSYKEAKENARQKAIDLQHEISNCAMSYEGIAIITDYLEKLGKRYGLLKEFRENGVI